MCETLQDVTECTIYRIHNLFIYFRAAGLIALTRRLTRLSINRVNIFNRALIVNLSASHFAL